MSRDIVVVITVLLFCCLIMHSLSLRLSSHIRRTPPLFRTKRLHSLSAKDTVTIRNSLTATDGNGPTYSKLDISKPVSWYSCGPTVYDASHLGHARTYVCTDVIRRILTNYFNVNLNYAMGITDIDDKIIDKARSNQMHTWVEMQQMVRALEDDFFHDLDRLNVLRPDTVLRVTEHIPEIIAYIARLVELKSAYVTADGVYFDFSSLQNEYDKFGCAHPGSEAAAVDNDSGAPIDTNAYQSNTKHHAKRHAKDFALWKLHRGDCSAEQQCTWESPWGPGRPGWHIECSAMTHSLFGSHIDIHSGGIDLKFPHHTNEIAQCESHNCAEHNGWVGAWIHLGHLHIEGRKMSKSLKNFISIDDYLQNKQTSHPGDDFRIYCLLHKYHSSLTYAPIRIQEAAKFRQKMEGFYSSVRAAIALYSAPVSARGAARSSSADALVSGTVGTVDSKAVGISRKPTAESAKLTALLRSLQDEVHAALCDDFDTPKVLHCLSQLVGESALYVQLVMADPVVTDSQAVTLLRSQPIEPLLSISAYISKILTMLGLKFPTALVSQQYLCESVDGVGAGSGGDASGSSGGGSAALSDDTIDAIVQFRSQVRTAALQGTKALRAQKKAAGSLTPLESQLEQSLAKIISSCDAGREALGKALAVKIDDMGSTSKWTKQ